MPEKAVRLLIIGYGNIANRMAQIISFEMSRYPNLAKIEIVPVGLFTRSRGGLVNAQGIDWQATWDHIKKNNRFTTAQRDFSNLSAMSMIESLDYDILVELSPLNIADGGEPAITHIRTALSRGHHVVTANKGPLAFAYQELISLANKMQCQFRFEATVMDGVPLFKTFTEEIAACRVESVSGILNSTTNFILTAYENGQSMAEAIVAAQEGGFAEADPAHDLDGWDGAAKISVLARVLMDSNITPLAVERESLMKISPEAVRETAKNGKHVKYICRAWREADGVKARVAPEVVGSDSLFANVRGTSSIVQIASDGMVPLTVLQQEPTLTDTAFGVLNDIVTIAAKIS